MNFLAILLGMMIGAVTFAIVWPWAAYVYTRYVDWVLGGRD